ncbi:MAG: homocysteine S-methyltransferase family protein [Gammaproteobacteria bacterium]
MSDISWLNERLSGAGSPVILDGGMGTALEQNGVPMDDKVWSGRAIVTHPDQVRSAHEAFIRAGAQAILTNTFSTARHMLEPGGLGAEVRRINERAVALAQEAVKRVAQQPVAIVGSICEWTVDKDPAWSAPEVVARAVREQAEVLVESGVDILALEMCERVELSEPVADVVTAMDVPVWIGVSARSHKGETDLASFSYADRDFEQTVKVLSRYPVDLINVMHTQLNDVHQALDVVQRYWEGPVGVYPESGFFTMPNWNFEDIVDPEELVAQAKTWIDRGVRLVGGCCGLNTDHIQALSRAFAH